MKAHRFMRWLIFAHRYLGIAVGVLMVIWCLSGMVMMYVQYPELSVSERVKHLPAIDWHGCCSISNDALADQTLVSAFEVEALGTTPVLRLKTADGKTSLIDLRDGHPKLKLSSQDAAAVAATYSQTGGLSGQPALEGLLQRDQWTVSGHFDAARPLYLFALADTNDTRIYVSSVNGQVVQATTARERFWNCLGAIPHWVYFTGLRQNVELWSQVVIGLSLIGSFLTLAGLYIGLQRFIQRPANRWSPYRGLMLWHHLTGLIFGMILLSWVVSGLVSMNPWGFLDSGDDNAVNLLLRGGAIPGSRVKSMIQALPILGTTPDIVSIHTAPLFGAVFLTATTRGGLRKRFDATGVPTPLDGEAWKRIAKLLDAQGSTPVEFLTNGDAYYFESPDSASAHPVYRIISNDQERTRYYFDPQTADLRARFDSNSRWYRWLFQGLHKLDFTAAWRGRPQWDALLLSLLTGAAMTSAFGTYVGWRKLLKSRAETQNL